MYICLYQMVSFVFTLLVKLMTQLLKGAIFLMSSLDCFMKPYLGIDSAGQWG